MDFANVVFSVSGVKTNLFVPPLVSFVLSFLTSMGGISGAFLLLPFQMSVLHYTAPSVSGTNHVYNIVAIPSGVYRYIREGRMAWPLTWVVIAGTLPGVFLGYLLRVRYLPDPRAFKFFVGFVLLVIGYRLFHDLLMRDQGAQPNGLDERFRKKIEEIKHRRGEHIAAGLPPEAVVRTLEFTFKRVEYEFWGERYSFGTAGMFLMALVVGIIGGAYGIGGGAIIAPFCVAVYRLPVYTIAGAVLMGTFITSLAGAFFFSVLPAVGGVSAAPDWALGVLFGLGGFIGVYLGARAQKYMPQKVIKVVIGSALLFLAVKYIVQFIR